MIQRLLSLLLNLIFPEVVEGARMFIGGLQSHVPDPRDFRYSALGGWFDYKPKQDRLLLPILEIKSQSPNNTCVFHSYAACREVDEQVTLSPRSLVAYAKLKGYLHADGLSSIRLGQQAGTEFGIAEESLVPNPNLSWQDYSGLRLTPDIYSSASKHRAKNYFWVKDKNEVLKALDDGHAIHTGMDWYSSYNMQGGLSAPWVLSWRRGVKVGGHAVKLCGYDIYKGLLIFQNSFGPAWGDQGKFYIRMSDWFAEGIEGAVAVDLDADTLATFIASHEGKDVKSDGDPGIYRIENGTKRPYPSEDIFHSWGGIINADGSGSFEPIASSLLDQIPDGDPMGMNQ